MSITARISSWVPASKMQGIYATRFWVNHVSLIWLIPPSLNIFLWKCETLQLNLSPWEKKKRQVHWAEKSKCIPYWEGCHGRRGCCLEAGPPWGGELEGVRRQRRGQRAHLQVSCFEHSGCGMCVVCVYARPRERENTAHFQNVFHGKGRT